MLNSQRQILQIAMKLSNIRPYTSKIKVMFYRNFYDGRGAGGAHKNEVYNTWSWHLSISSIGEGVGGYYLS